MLCKTRLSFIGVCAVLLVYVAVGVDSLILDLRNNQGGLVQAGMRIADAFLDGAPTIVNVVDRSGRTLPVKASAPSTENAHRAVCESNGTRMA